LPPCSAGRTRRSDTLTERERVDRCAGRLLGKVRRTCRRWTLTPEDARVAVALSGGVDSLVMAYLLVRNNATLRRPLDLWAYHVRLNAEGPTKGLEPELHSFCAEIGLELEEVMPRFDITDEAPFDCYRCAHVRRRTLLEVANEAGYSHLALGHHADDVVETWLLSLLYTGRGEAMAPSRDYFQGTVTVVRPLFELRKSEIERLARLGSFPSKPPRCGREVDARRRRVVDALASLGRDQKLVRRQLFWAAVRQLGEAGPDREV
jgi:tRNA 2-thiocytidine biosynthesis protein TtcA